MRTYKWQYVKDDCLETKPFLNIYSSERLSLFFTNIILHRYYLKEFDIVSTLNLKANLQKCDIFIITCSVQNSNLEPQAQNWKELK